MSGDSKERKLREREEKTRKERRGGGQKRPSNQKGQGLMWLLRSWGRPHWFSYSSTQVMWPWIMDYKYNSGNEKKMLVAPFIANWFFSFKWNWWVQHFFLLFQKYEEWFSFLFKSYIVSFKKPKFWLPCITNTHTYIW